MLTIHYLSWTSLVEQFASPVFSQVAIPKEVDIFQKCVASLCWTVYIAFHLVYMSFTRISTLTAASYGTYPYIPILRT